MKIGVNGLGELDEEANRIVESIGGREFVGAMRKATLVVMRTAQQEAKVDTGRYRASITPAVELRGRTIRGIVGSNLESAPFTVLDTRPHWPPISALTVWARRHGISAFLVARAISRHGTKGDYSLMKGLEKNSAKIMKILADAVERIVRR